MRIPLALSLLLSTVGATQAINITLIDLAHPGCSTPDGYINVMVTGGAPPYNYQWNNGATTQNLAGLGPGYYELTVTDAMNAQATQGYDLQVAPLSSPPSAQDGHASCIGSMSGRVQVIEWGINGTPPYTYSPSPDGIDSQGDPYFEFFGTPPGSEVQIQVTDALGCTGTLTEYIMAPQLIGGPEMTVSWVQGSCSNGTGGSAQVGNVYDGAFFGGPDYALLDAGDNYVTGGFSVGNTISLVGLAPGTYHLVRDWDPNDVYMAYSCEGNPFNRIDFVIPDLGPDCGSVSGSAFIDFDSDCVLDPVDLPIPFQVLEIQPGPVHTITNALGTYSIDLVDGSYTLAQTDPNLVQVCPVTAPVPFTVASNQATIVLASTSTIPLDARAELGSGPMRPGFDGMIWGEVRNLTPQLSGAVTLTLTLDPALTFLSAQPVPFSVNAGLITWQLPALAPLSGSDVSVQVHVPSAVSIGTPLSSSFSVTCEFAEGDLSNNTAVVAQLTTGSYDPNDKLARTSTGLSDAHYFINEDEWVDYTIRFQNTGTDTAFTVVITDTLADELDMSTFEQGVGSHPFDVAFKPGRVVEWRFDDILLPDSGTNEPASHGLISFRIRPELLTAGTVIENTANIYFDFNPPVITEPSVLVAEFSTTVQERADELLMIQPNPASDRIRVSVSQGAIGGVRILSLDGRTVKTINVRGTSVELDIHDLRAGVYLMESEGETIGRVRFVKH